MIRTTNLQLPKYIAKTITFAKSRSTPPLKMEKKLVNEQEEPLNPKPKKNLTLKVSQIPIMHLSFGCARFNSDFSVDEERKKMDEKRFRSMTKIGHSLHRILAMF
jgi:hypothetical protein